MQPLNLTGANLKSLLSLKAQVDTAIELKISQLQLENLQLQEQWKSRLSQQPIENRRFEKKKSNKLSESDTVLVSGFTDKWNLTKIMEEASIFGCLKHGEYKHDEDDEMDSVVYLIFQYWSEANDFVEYYSHGHVAHPFSVEKVKHLKSAEELDAELEVYMGGH